MAVQILLYQNLRIYFSQVTLKARLELNHHVTCRLLYSTTMGNTSTTVMMCKFKSQAQKYNLYILSAP